MCSFGIIDVSPLDHLCGPMDHLCGPQDHHVVHGSPMWSPLITYVVPLITYVVPLDHLCGPHWITFVVPLDPMCPHGSPMWFHWITSGSTGSPMWFHWIIYVVPTGSPMWFHWITCGSTGSPMWVHWITYVFHWIIYVVHWITYVVPTGSLMWSHVSLSRTRLRPTGVQGSDYVNASCIHGYRLRNAYIAAQAPLQNTVEDFWRMVWEFKSLNIVMLCHLDEDRVVQYWPMRPGETLMFGKMAVTLTGNPDVSSKDQITVYRLEGRMRRFQIKIASPQISSTMLVGLNTALHHQVLQCSSWLPKLSLSKLKTSA
eukprot:Em0011g1210a